MWFGVYIVSPVRGTIHQSSALSPEIQALAEQLSQLSIPKVDIAPLEAQQNPIMWFGTLIGCSGFRV